MVRVTVSAALVVPTFWPLKVSEVGETLGGTEPAPVPLRLAVCGLLAALSVTVSIALRAPAAVGVNVTSMEQLAPAARVVPQLFVWAKSPLLVPVIEILEILTDELVPFDSATACAALVDPGVWLANVSEDGDRLTVGLPVEADPLNAAKILPFQFEAV